MNAIVIDERGGVNAYDVCMRLKDNGLLVCLDLAFESWSAQVASPCCCCLRLTWLDVS